MPLFCHRVQHPPKAEAAGKFRSKNIGRKDLYVISGCEIFSSSCCGSGRCELASRAFGQRQNFCPVANAVGAWTQGTDFSSNLALEPVLGAMGRSTSHALALELPRKLSERLSPRSRGGGPPGRTSNCAQSGPQVAKQGATRFVRRYLISWIPGCLCGAGARALTAGSGAKKMAQTESISPSRVRPKHCSYYSQSILHKQGR